MEDLLNGFDDDVIIVTAVHYYIRILIIEKVDVDFIGIVNNADRGNDYENHFDFVLGLTGHTAAVVD